MEKKGNRDQMVIATKFTTAYRKIHFGKETIINTTGNGTKSLHVSLGNSLKKLKTSYIDLVCLVEA
jgi:aryl-alcohol dehydrogenase-like predicted oxidoreductase